MVTEPPKVNDDVAAPLERWILTPSDLALILTKHRANRLSFAVLLAFVRDQGRFPLTASEVDDLLVEQIAQQLAIAIPTDFTLSLSGRTAERRRAEIRALVGFREATVADAELLEGWLRDQVAVARPTRGASGDAVSRAFDRAARGRSRRPDRPRCDPCS